MSKSLLNHLFHLKPVEGVPEGHHLRRCLTSADLTFLGIGAIIGAGIFVLTGIAAATQAGPGIILSYILAGIACGLSALAYAELASSVGGCGSAYGYAYATLGELIAWIIGWDLILEYGLDGATVSIGWSGYVQDALAAVGIHLPHAFLTDPFHGGLVNLPAILVIALLAIILSLGAKESVKFNKIIVFIKLFVIALFIAIGSWHFNPQNWHPFLPFGAQGIVNGASLIFFAYIGFDAVSTTADESINPQRDLPIGIMASLIICGAIYILFAGVLTGMISYTKLNVSSPAAVALVSLGFKLSAEIISLGAIAGLTTAILAMLYGASRVFYAMSCDGLFPVFFAKVHEKSQTPRRLIWIIAAIMALTAGFLPISELANLVNMGTLSAFVVVCISVVILRYTKPNMPRSFVTPLSPLLPLVGVGLCLYLMVSLPALTWYSFTIWTILGLCIYFGFGIKSSALRAE